MVFAIWTSLVIAVFLFMTYRTIRFRQYLLNLKSLPEQLRLSPQEKALADHNGLWPKLSIVIPACNEGSTIHEAMLSLLKVDYPNLEIIAVNDRSNDKTRQIIDQLSVADDRIVPVHVNFLPLGWLGKVNALQRGMDMTTSDWVLFTDADVHYSEDSLKSAMGYCLKDKIDFLTIIPDVKASSLWLRAVIAELFHLGTLFFDPRKINDPRNPVCYGQGAFMLMRKSAYLKSERLQWLKMEVLDDTGLALLMRRAGAKMAAVSGKDKVALEWYPNLTGFARGIEKNAFAFMQYSKLILFSSFLGFLFLFLGFTVAPVLAGPVWPVAMGAVLALYLFAMHQQLNVIMNVSKLTILTFPVTFVAVPILFLRGALLTLFRGGISWRGTFYDIESLKKNQKMKLPNLVIRRNRFAKNSAVENLRAS